MTERETRRVLVQFCQTSVPCNDVAPWDRSVRDPILTPAVTKCLVEVLRLPQTRETITVPPIPVLQLQRQLKGG